MVPQSLSLDMSRIKLYFLPIALLTTIVLQQMDLFHVGYIYINSHELKWTNLDYLFLADKGEVYPAGESVTNNNYEDAVIGFKPDFNALHQDDLNDIASSREFIDSIDRQSMSFFSGNYAVRTNLTQNDVNIIDTILFKKMVNVEVLGQFELYDINDCDKLLFIDEGQKFWIRDKIMITGFAPEELIKNKIDEIVIAQMSNYLESFISKYERRKDFEMTEFSINDEEFKLTDNAQALIKYRAFEIAK